MSLSKKISTRERTFISIGLIFIVILTIILIFSYRTGKFTPQAATTQTFSDVPTTYWAYRQIEAIYAAGITGGCATNPLRYCPEDSVTREQMSAFLAKSYYYPNQPPNPQHPGSYYFTDVSAGSPFNNYIGLIKELGITQGCTTTTYCPTQAVSREQMAVFLVRTLKLDTSIFDPNNFDTYVMSFDDVLSTNQFWKEIQAVYWQGISMGCTSETYCPSDNVTRAQMAVFLSNGVLNNRGEGEVNISVQVCTSPPGQSCQPAVNADLEVDKIGSTGEIFVYFRARTNSQGRVDLKSLANNRNYQIVATAANAQAGHCDFGYKNTPTLAAGNYQYTINIYPQVTFYRGTVKTADTDLPIEGVEVKIIDAQGYIQTVGYTDWDGNYSLIGTFETAPKTHQMYVSVSGYQTQVINLTSAICTTKTQNFSLVRLNY